MNQRPQARPTQAQWIECVYRFCPRCGAETDRIGQTPFRCHECGFSQFFGPVAAVGALVIDPQQRLLLVRRARDPGKGKWGLPGGFVDRNESIEQALEREIEEETKLPVTHVRYLISYPNQYNYHGVIAPVIDLFYTALADSGHHIELDREELDYFEWVYPTKTHLDEMAFPSNRKAIEHWMSHHE